MSELDTAAIRKRLAAASGGDWIVTYPHTVWQGVGGYSCHISTLSSLKPKADAEFIAHSKEDIRKLLRKVDELELEVEALQEDLKDSYSEMEIARESYPEID